jgi:hypothetical protein
MSAYDVVLALHITAALALFALAGLVHGSEWLTLRARTVAELRPLAWSMRLAFGFPVLGTTLVVLGVVLVLLAPANDHIGFGTPFVWSGLVAFAILTASGSVMRPYAVRITEAVEAAPDGPIPPEVAAAVHDRRGIVTGHMTTFLTLAVAFDMATKPNAVVAPGVLVVGLAVGAAVGARFRPAADQVAAPAASV